MKRRVTNMFDILQFALIVFWKDYWSSQALIKDQDMHFTNIGSSNIAHNLLLFTQHWWSRWTFTIRRSSDRSFTIAIILYIGNVRAYAWSWLPYTNRRRWRRRSPTTYTSCWFPPPNTSPHSLLGANDSLARRVFGTTAHVIRLPT